MILCEKTSFADQKSAQEYMIHIFFDKTKRRITPNRTYLCPSCNTWHLSSNGKNDDVYELKIKQLEDKIEELSSKKKFDNNANIQSEKKNKKLELKIKNEINTIVKRDKHIEKLNSKVFEYKERLEKLRSKDYVIDRFFGLLSTEKDLDVLEGIKKYAEDKILNIKKIQ